MDEKSSVAWKFWLYQPYKWLILMPLMLINSIVFALLAIIMSLCVSPRAGSLMGKTWALITCWLTPVSVKVKGQNNISERKSYVIVSNHQTGFDIFLLYGYLPIDFKWVMKKELRNLPFIGLASEKVGHIFIDRSSPRAAVQTLEEAKRKLVNGTSVLIFPEGTRSRNNQMRPFKKGAFKLAMDLDLDILPVTIQNSHKIKRAGFMNLVPGNAGLVVHPMIKTSGFKDDISGLMIKTRHVIESELPSD
ncbi:lysophospholipid acyltransferase family protein [Alkalitalea saponilacus]|uniref:1-acyl-sn-glycerol-3-phosphate acyltransferase n=1 Tax=Alkalitalea saponilacus TaxID=889453 RepID=A0A1T5D8C5_9BACT|nr:lysophospholipid acyltransferase family protein [Alkalitalea saponilacus]ASB50621.1 1-acyl-sn-glycerol-3-phosphate acyltransferase [Alkalitalea saponilacus]SKB68038.1 1-acyl-sn-glycerol-3-phosphate acyltransferase [Alkalitalea saponilacus]